MRVRLIALATAIAIVTLACSGGDDAESGEPTTSPGGPQIGDASAGQSLFSGTCVACHGADATGISELGKTLVGSEFANGLSDVDLVAFLEVGRSDGDPANTTGLDMPPKGGNPSLDGDDLFDIVAYIRSLN